MMSAGWGGVRRLEVFVRLTLQNASKRILVVRYSDPYSAQQLKSRGLCTSPCFGSSCKPCSALERTRFWKLMESLGLSKCRMITLRRKMKKYSYPWLCYALPAAVILATGDLLAQYFYGPNPKEMSLCCFYSKYWCRERTLVYFLKGLLLVGPVLSWWNLLWFRKLRCRRRLTYILVKTFVDVFILAPLLVSLMALIYDQTIESNIFNTDWETTKKRMRCRYVPAIADVLAFNALTRPLMALVVCYLVPVHLRRSTRVLYELALAAFISHTFAKHRLRVHRPTPPSASCPAPAPAPATPPPAPKRTSAPRNLWKWPC